MILVGQLVRLGLAWSGRLVHRASGLLASGGPASLGARGAVSKPRLKPWLAALLSWSPKGG